MILLALSFQLSLVNTLLTILNSSSLHPLKFLPALKCSLDFFTILLPFPSDSNTHQKFYLPNFQPPFFKSPLHHFLFRPPSLQDRIVLANPQLFLLRQPFTNHHRPMFATFGALQFLAIVLLVTHLMGTAMWSRIFHFCNCFSSCSLNFSLFVFALVGSHSLQKVFVNFTLCFVTHSMSNPSNLISFQIVPCCLETILHLPPPTDGSWWRFASIYASIPAVIPDLVFLLDLLHVLVNLLSKFVSPLHVTAKKRMLSKTTSTHLVLWRQCLVLLINFLFWLFSP